MPLINGKIVFSISKLKYEGDKVIVQVSFISPKNFFLRNQIPLSSFILMI